MPKQRKPVNEMSFPAQVAEMAEHAVGKVRRAMGRGKLTRQGRTYDDILDEAEIGRRRSNQSTDDDN